MLPYDELLAAPIPLDPSAPDSTVAVHADGVVALSVERYLDELRLWHDTPIPSRWTFGRRSRRSTNHRPPEKCSELLFDDAPTEARAARAAA